jgi:hypothetical protein
VRKSAIVQISDSPRLFLENYTWLVLVSSPPEAISPVTLCGIFFTAIAHQIAEAGPEWYDATGEVVCTTSLISWLRKLVVESVRLLAILGVTDRSLLKGYFSPWLVVEFDLSSRVYGDTFLRTLCSINVSGVAFWIPELSLLGVAGKHHLTSILDAIRSVIDGTAKLRISKDGDIYESSLGNPHPDANQNDKYNYGTWLRL